MPVSDNDDSEGTGSAVRKATADDLATLVAANNAELPHVGPLDMETLTRLWSEAAELTVATIDRELAGFALVFLPGADYNSANYLWFSDRYSDFLYLDRIVVLPAFQGRGIGRRLYRHYCDAFSGRVAQITCEVNERPANPGSMAFHEQLGFRVVGRQETEGGAKSVVLLARAID